MTVLFRPISRQKPARAGRLVPFALAAAALLALGSLGLACRQIETDYGECVGGVIIDGVCEGKCTPDKCIEQNTCVDNRCVLLCASHAECHADGVQSCAPAVEDDTDRAIFVCQDSGKPVGMGAPCFTAAECDTFRACPEGGGCRVDQCGGAPETCAPDEAACGGASACTTGKCPNGDPCRIGCEADCSPWLECEAAGEGDVNAYCTQRDCETDDDCIAGFHCGIIRTPFDVCGPACTGPDGAKTCVGGDRDGQPCDADGECQKGNDEVCGETTSACKSPGEGGATFFEGSLCLLRRSCLKRGPGDPCESDTDCSRVAGQRCADVAGERRCAPTCTSDFECLSDAACDLDQGACLPKFGAWVGSGGFCEPCVTDEDCGQKGSTVACAILPGAGRACFDHAHPVECATDADCPLSPGGLRGACLDEGEGYDSGDALYHRCSLPVDPATEKPSCW